VASVVATDVEDKEETAVAAMVAAMADETAVSAAGDLGVRSTTSGDMKPTTATIASTPNISHPSSEEVTLPRRTSTTTTLDHGFRGNRSPDKRVGPPSHP
jgi:hypothetical protein